MPQKLNKAGKMQDYIPAGNGDPSGEYGTSKGTNKNFTTSDKKKTEANIITENKSVVVGNKEKHRDYTGGKTPSVKGKKETFNLKNGYTGDFYVVDELPNGWRVDEGATTAPHGYVWVNNNESLFNGKRETAIMKRDNLNSNKANIIDNDLSGVKKNDNLTPTNALKIEKMNEAQLDNEIARTQREIDRLDSVMKSNTKESELTKQFPLGVGGSGWSADRKKQFVKNIESETKQAKNFTDAYKDKESLKNRLDALNKAKEQVKGTGKTQEQLKQNVINNTQNTINWEKGKIANPYGKGEINVIKANGYEIRSVDNDFYSIYKDGKSVGNTNKLKDAKAYVERIVQKQSKANVIS